MNRKIQLVEGEIYHIFTRGVEKRAIFSKDEDYQRFLLMMYLVNDASSGKLHIDRLLQSKSGPSRTWTKLIEEADERDKLVEIQAWSLMSTHPHLLLKQLQENGISIFMQRLLTSHAKYYNTVYGRVGALFGGRFKSVHITDDVQHAHTSRYIHINSLTLLDPMWKERGYIEDKLGAEKFLKEYRWSSLPEYLGIRDEFAPIIDKGPIMECFENKSEEYWKFITDWTKSDFVHLD